MADNSCLKCKFIFITFLSHHSCYMTNIIFHINTFIYCFPYKCCNSYRTSKNKFYCYEINFCEIIDSGHERWNDVTTKYVYCHVVSEYSISYHDRIYGTINIQKTFVIENLQLMVLIFIYKYNRVYDWIIQIIKSAFPLTLFKRFKVW